MILPWIYQCFSNVFPMIFPCFSDVFPMFFSHDFSMIFQCFCYVFPIEQTAVVCGGGAFRVSCGALDHGAGPEKPTIKVTWSPKRWEWTSVYCTVYNIILYIYIEILCFLIFVGNCHCILGRRWWPLVPRRAWGRTSCCQPFNMCAMGANGHPTWGARQ